MKTVGSGQLTVVMGCEVGARPSRISNFRVAHVKRGFSRIDAQMVGIWLAVEVECPPLLDG